MERQKVCEEYSDFEEIGSGGFATVFSAVHKPTSRTVAIKRVSKELLTGKYEAKNFKREIEIMKKVDHPFIAHFYDFIETPHHYYIVMEYCKNGTLLNRINSNGQLPIVEIKRIFAQIISALNYLHNTLKIAHRDLKLENILFDDNYNIRLIDFGLSCQETKDKQPFKTLCGSFPYAAPEIFKQIPYTYELDIWSLGVCIYASAAGCLPFQDQNTSHLAAKIMNEEPWYPFSFTPELTDLLKKMLKKDMNERATMEMIIDHPFFAHTQIHMFTSSNFLCVAPEKTTGIDSSIAEEMKKAGMDVNLITNPGTRESVYYRIERKEQIKRLICESEAFTHENPLIKKTSAPLVPLVNASFAKALRKTSMQANSLNSRPGMPKRPRHLSTLARNNTNYKYLSKKKNIIIQPTPDIYSTK